MYKNCEYFCLRQEIDISHYPYQDLVARGTHSGHWSDANQVNGHAKKRCQKVKENITNGIINQEKNYHKSICLMAKK